MLLLIGRDRIRRNIKDEHLAELLIACYDVSPSRPRFGFFLDPPYIE